MGVCWAFHTICLNSSLYMRFGFSIQMSPSSTDSRLCVCQSLASQRLSQWCSASQSQAHHFQVTPQADTFLLLCSDNSKKCFQQRLYLINKERCTTVYWGLWETEETLIKIDFQSLWIHPELEKIRIDFFSQVLINCYVNKIKGNSSLIKNTIHVFV